MTPDLADRFAAIALGHVTREYPNKLDHVLAGPQDARGPRELHPVFYGSFDWHSCVHGYWMLAHLYRRFPDHAQRRGDPRLVRRAPDPRPDRRRVRLSGRPRRIGFERPYGWAWLLKLAAELALHERRRATPGPPPSNRWPVSSLSGSRRSCRSPPTRSAPASTPTPPLPCGWPWITRTSHCAPC